MLPTWIDVSDFTPTDRIVTYSNTKQKTLFVFLKHKYGTTCMFVDHIVNGIRVEDEIKRFEDNISITDATNEMIKWMKENQE